MADRAIVTARLDVPRDSTIGTNGFEIDEPCPAYRFGAGWMVDLGGGWERFVSADGSGGAHLQRRTFNRHGFDIVETVGHFEIVEVP